MNNAPVKNREPAMDIIRCFAFLFVVSVHFFWNSGFYSVKVSGEIMYGMVLLRSLSMICVPLFLLLTGYLTSDRKISRGYYKKLPHTLIIYGIASLLCLLFRIFVMKTEFTKTGIIQGFFDFTHAPYGWYVEMYIGIFLLCPFLNIMYHGIPDRKKKNLLLFILIVLTSLPSILNIFEFSKAAFLNPAGSESYFPVLPDFWVFLYPVTYYFIGAYLKEYKINIRSRYIFILMVLVFVLNGTFSFYRSMNDFFVWGPWADHNGFGQLVQTVLFFLFFKNLNYKNFPPVLSSVLGHISKLTFCAYLVSWIFDTAFYNILNSRQYDFPEKVSYYIVLVVSVAVCSLAVSFIVNLFYDLTAYSFRRLKALIKEKKSAA